MVASVYRKIFWENIQSSYLFEPPALLCCLVSIGLFLETIRTKFRLNFAEILKHFYD